MQIFLFFLCLWAASGQALVLEELIQTNELEATLRNKKIGYFIGSFDPLHIGHEAIAQTPIQNGLCEFVILFPAWGGDSYKSRIDVSIRQEMLFSVFQNHPQIFVTRLTPLELQEALTVPKEETEFVKPAFEGTLFIGIVGSDTALWLHDQGKGSSTYMTGQQIPEMYRTHTWGGCMALPVESFIIALREGDDLIPLGKKLRDKPILATFESETWRTLSSTKVKKALEEAKPIHLMVSDSVREIIEKERLYQ